MTWRKLDMCFKWRVLQVYLKGRGLEEGTQRRLRSRARELLRTRQLTTVDYNSMRQVVTRVVCDPPI